MSRLIVSTILKTAFLIAALSSPLSVPAHAILVKSQPAKDETLTQSPKQIDLWFNEAVKTEYKALAVIDSTGNRVDNRDVGQTPTDSANIYATVPPLVPGSYLVRYRVVSEDTQIVTGKFQFSVKP